jgi:hypothetical protein
MPLTVRPTGRHSPVYADRQDWTIFGDGEPVGRVYEDTSTDTAPELRWFWSIIVYVNPKAGIVTSGKVATPGEAQGGSSRRPGGTRWHGRKLVRATVAAAAPASHRHEVGQAGSMPLRAAALAYSTEWLAGQAVASGDA